MVDILLFCEDSFHEHFVGSLLARFSREYAVEINPRVRSSRGGLSKLQSEFKEFLRDLSKEQHPRPDRVIVVADANCIGFQNRRRNLEDVLQKYPDFQQLVSYAIPEPHVERWMLADATAFKKVFDRGCTLPAVKCKKDEYKKLLLDEIRASGVEPALGGQEYAKDIVDQMNLPQVENNEPSLGRFLKELKGLFNGWKASLP